MSSTKNPGRFAGLLYVVMGIPSFFAIEYVPSKLIVPGNATATASNIAANETLFRLVIAGELIGQAGFIFVALALYHLLKGVNRRYASLMVTLVVLGIPIGFLNELNSIAALSLVRGADFLSIFEKPQREALAMLFLNLGASRKLLHSPVPVAQSLAYAQTRHPVSRLLGPRSDGALLITERL